MENLTPAMQQFMTIKNQYKDCIVFFRMGDFYETFYEDAKVTAKTLDIALTKRGIRNSDKTIPLAGIPYHALDTYLSKMIKSGFKVAIVEQLEDPKFAKGIVKRGVTRVVTPGTVIDDFILTKNNNFIAAISFGDKFGLSFMDISTGEFITTQLNTFEDVMNELEKFNPRELVLPMSFETEKKYSDRFKEKGYYLTYRTDVDFFIENATINLKNHLNEDSINNLGLKNKDYAVSASGALVTYIYETQKNSLTHINSIKFYSNTDYLEMDSTTISNLELVKSKNNKEDSLIGILDHTRTSMGSRLLKNFLMKPLIDISKINDRLVCVDELSKKHFILEETRDLLKNIADIERLISRINYGNSNPRDLVLLQGSLGLVPSIKNILFELDAKLITKLIDIDELKNITMLIDRAIIDDPPVNIADGMFIKDGYDEKLDNYRRISRDAKQVIKKLEEDERKRTKIRSLKIKFNRIFGYYIDITKANLHLVPDNYVKKQTMVNSDRFITDELKTLEEQILSAQEKIVKLEQEIFLKIVDEIKKETKNIQKIAESIAYIDVLTSFTKVSVLNNYKKPLLTENYELILKNNRHPIVEKITDFISNDIEINQDNKMMIITGPNMAGKSVYMKQVAITVIMAQIGCFVPCSVAQIGIVDKVFCRTGASDDITMGHSTFMVEMDQTAQILNNATEKSLIVLDEIGRGTSTYDGVAIAWSVAEYIATVLKSKTLFATHYHVLNKMEEEIKGVKNYNIAVQESNEKIIFLRKILKGGTDKSYGIHVAKLAGMPKQVIDRSKEIQFKLESDDDISQKIIVETRKSEEKDPVSQEIEETKYMIKSKQLRLDEL
jgi:DNA mismatch repair protein MutS